MATTTESEWRPRLLGSPPINYNAQRLYDTPAINSLQTLQEPAASSTWSRDWCFPDPHYFLTPASAWSSSVGHVGNSDEHPSFNLGTYENIDDFEQISRASFPQFLGNASFWPNWNFITTPNRLNTFTLEERAYLTDENADKFLLEHTTEPPSSPFFGAPLNPSHHVNATGVTDTQHGRFFKGKETDCHECSTSFPTKTGLDNHAKLSQHSPYLCQCGKAFSRNDCLDRHLQTFKATGANKSFPCPYCQKYSGSKAFARRDHLNQHLRGFHNIELLSKLDDSHPSAAGRRSRKRALSCPYSDCLYHHVGRPTSNQSQESMPAFQTQAELTRHIRDMHNESRFPCTEEGCFRVGAKGFFRKRDLLRHRKDCHSSQPTITAIS